MGSMSSPAPAAFRWRTIAVPVLLPTAMFGLGEGAILPVMPTLADDLLPERAFAGDILARTALVQRIYLPLKAQSTDLLQTLWSYLDNGRPLEATARELFVHPNTVRYRLKRITETIGWDATGAREALILQSAIIIGSITEPEGGQRRRGV